MTMTNEEWRKHPYYKSDPLAGQIQPALLNSEDIHKYIEKGCLIEEKNFFPDRMKTASYEMRFLGELYDWIATNDGRLQPRCRTICDGCEVELPRNSISYLWMKEKLLLPEYIAARYNLAIRHVHKGILLGTGPLVDPGFGGNLLIPLHNLTDNKYTLKGGEGIIWVEFTKVSNNNFWSKKVTDRPPRLKSFSITKSLNDPHSYFERSGVARAGGVQSAFKGALDRAEKHAKDARDDVGQIKSIGIVAIVIGFLAIAGSIAGLWYSGYDLISRSSTIAQDSHNRIFHAQIKEQDNRIRDLEEKMAELIRKGEVSEGIRTSSVEKPTD